MLSLVIISISMEATRIRFKSVESMTANSRKVKKLNLQKNFSARRVLKKDCLKSKVHKFLTE